MKGRTLAWELVEIAGAIAATYRAGKWAVACAYLERGYDARR